MCKYSYFFISEFYIYFRVQHTIFHPERSEGSKIHPQNAIVVIEILPPSGRLNDKFEFTLHERQL